ncbi:MAG TPA: hypothetical protein VM074_01695 [Solimonas sp.]|nr:hypothetical protein [Solimonas sp.]
MHSELAAGLIGEAERWLAPHRAALGRDLPAYLNHVRRVLCFYVLLCERQKLRPDPAAAAAAAYHDIGIWTDRTFDYLEPSSAGLARALAAAGKPELLDAGAAMVLWHHKLTPADPHLPYATELFRRADWIDVSLGLLRFGLRFSTVGSVRRRYPNLGFHWRLVQLTCRQFLRRPWNPLPMLRR